jgi:hypothetical protein
MSSQINYAPHTNSLSFVMRATTYALLAGGLLLGGCKKPEEAVAPPVPVQAEKA